MSRRDSDESKNRRGHSVSCDPLDIELARIREQLVSLHGLSSCTQASWSAVVVQPSV